MCLHVYKMSRCFLALHSYVMFEHEILCSLQHIEHPSWFKNFWQKMSHFASCRKHNILHVSKNFVQQLNICGENLPNKGLFDCSIWCT